MPLLKTLCARETKLVAPSRERLFIYANNEKICQNVKKRLQFQTKSINLKDKRENVN